MCMPCLPSSYPKTPSLALALTPYINRPQVWELDVHAIRAVAAGCPALKCLALPFCIEEDASTWRSGQAEAQGAMKALRACWPQLEVSPGARTS